MPSKFRRGAYAYSDNGRRFTVDEVEGGTVYCVGDNGAETEFSDNNLLTEAEWAARSAKRGASVYTRLKQSPLYAKPANTQSGARLDRGAAFAVLARIEKLHPGILDFAAVTTAERILGDAGEGELAAGLSISKCRDVFEEAPPETRAGLLAALLAMPPETLVNTARLGDNLIRALVEKGMAGRAEAFEAFCDRPRS